MYGDLSHDERKAQTVVRDSQSTIQDPFDYIRDREKAIGSRCRKISASRRMWLEESMENGQLAASQPRAVQPAQSALNVDVRYRSSWSTTHFLSLPPSLRLISTDNIITLNDISQIQSIDVYDLY